MQGGRGRGGGGGGGNGRNPFPEFSDPFAGFGTFSSPGNLMSSFFGRNPMSDSLFPSPFGGGNPFNDPFFTRPFGESMFDSGFFGPMANPFASMQPAGFIGHQQAPEPRTSQGPIIEEISGDESEEADNETRTENPRKHRRLSNGPYVEDPDDAAEEKKSRLSQHGNNYNELFNQRHSSQPQARSYTFHSTSVTFGGPDGVYQTSSQTRRSGSDGVIFEESKEADTATGQASHRVSKGLYDKGHSVTRKLNSDGNVDTMQTLHNLNEDQLSGFEGAWNGMAQKHLPGWHGSSSNPGGVYSSTVFPGASRSRSGIGHNSRGGWALPSTESSQHRGRVVIDSADNAGSSRSRVTDTRNRSFNPQARPRD